MMRLAKFLAQAGVASRRASEVLIQSGAVTVNGTKITAVATNVNPVADIIRVRGRIVRPERHVYYVLHKPIGYVSAARSSKKETLVTSLVPSVPRVYPVGRLDKDSSGLLLMTNDGEVALKLMHPRYAVKKVYEVTLDHPCSGMLISRLRSGVRLREGIARADAVEKISPLKMHVTLHQGFNRQVRRMLGASGYTALALKRITEGNLKLGNLKEGAYRRISREELMV